MYCRRVILLLTIFIENQLATAGRNITEFCGKLIKGTEQKGHNVTLLYTPNEKYLNHTRKWKRTDNAHQLVFDSSNLTSSSTKYNEVSSGNEYRLIISDASHEDSGVYAVVCQEDPAVYSEPYSLEIKQADEPITYTTTESMNSTSAKDETLAPSADNTKTNTSMGPTSTTEADEPITYPTTKAMSSSSAKDEKLAPSADNNKTYTSMGPTSTTKADESTIYLTTKAMSTTSAKDEQLSPYADKTNLKTFTIIRPADTTIRNKVSSPNQEKNDVPTTRKPKDSTTQKWQGGTSEIASDEKTRNVEQNSNLSIAWVVLVLIAVLVVIVVIVVILWKRQKRKQKTPNVSQEGARYSRIDAINEMTEQTDGIPEYAKVIPKEQRTREAKQETCEETKTRINNTETNNQLVYAELDLQPPGTFKQSADQCKATEYVSVDFTKMATTQGNESTPEKKDATEHVSVDFTKTGTIQGNDSTPDKNVATEYVSVDFTKTATTQGNESMPEKKEATELVSVDFTKTATSQGNDSTPEKNVATEYVSVDFTKTGTIQGNDGTSEKNVATEYVSVDFTKTATSQGNESTPEKKEATEYVSVDITKNGNYPRK